MVRVRPPPQREGARSEYPLLPESFTTETRHALQGRHFTAILVKRGVAGLVTVLKGSACSSRSSAAQLSQQGVTDMQSASVLDTTGHNARIFFDPKLADVYAKSERH